MGYTHYWNFKQNPKDIKDGEKKFKKAVTLLKKCIANVPSEIEYVEYDKNYEPNKVMVPFKLAGGNGTGEPIFNDDKVCFNGCDGEKDYAHETCYLALDDANDYSFNFCKTAEKPYDVAVCLALLCFKKAFGRDFEYSSDGVETEEYGWVLAHKIFDEAK